MSAEVLENDWVRVSADSGTGNTELQAAVKKLNTGRVERNVVLKGTTAHDAVGTAIIRQGSTPKGEYVTFDSPKAKTIPNSGTTITVTGKSNAKSLTFTLVTSGVGITDYLSPLPATYTVITSDNIPHTVDNGANIENDPGESEEYAFQITLTCSASPSNTRMQQLNVTGYSGNTDTATITQEGIATSILFDGYASGTEYSLDGLQVGQSVAINIGVSPNDEPWTLEFDE